MQSDKCNICGGELIQKIQGSVQEFYCDTCSYSVVTTYIDKIHRDDRDYIISIVNGDFKNKTHIHFISKFCAVNYLVARKMLINMNFIDIIGKALYIKDIATEAKLASLAYQINPEFPYC